MSNDPVRDSYNPPGLVVEFEHFKFSDINIDELVWFSDDKNSNLNHAYRKINENQAQDTITREIVSVSPTAHSYQKI